MPIIAPVVDVTTSLIMYDSLKSSASAGATKEKKRRE